MERQEIKRLSDDVINKIAAGEVIQRPANAIKEMLENCLDAKATNIIITLKDGGLKYLQIQDNGHGIRKEDMEIVCERFTTSKLSNYDDLSNMSTYGFRGEALASISHVAHVTIVTRTSDTLCAYKASYSNGKIKDAVKPCAGNIGTQITVEDLFYNVPIRKLSLKNANEEHQKVVDIVSRYAIHNSTVGFLVKKQGEINADVRTLSNSSIADNIKIIYGASIFRELVEIEIENNQLHYKLNAIITNANYNTKKKIFLLFINHRLVDSINLRRGIDNIYSTYLPKNTYPFVYISLLLPPGNIDVNVHPTKHEVHFLHEEEIVESIQRSIQAKLIGSNISRTYLPHNVLPSKIITNESSSNVTDKIAQRDLVRTDSRERRLDSFLSNPLITTSAKSTQDLNNTISTTKEKQLHHTKLSSIVQLKEEIQLSLHDGLKDIFQNHTFVGCVDNTFSLIQYQTRLYLINVPRLSKAYFYQLFIHNFGNFGIMKLSEEASIFELAMLGLDAEESGWTPSDGDKKDLANYVVNLLTSKAEMLQDYFSLQISDSGTLVALPLLLDKYVPNLTGLPNYILRLATEVNWEEEKACFKTFAEETSLFYSANEINFDPFNDEDDMRKEGSPAWVVENCLLPAMKATFLPPKTCSDDASVLQLANLPDLYKVFERC